MLVSGFTGASGVLGPRRLAACGLCCVCWYGWQSSTSVGGTDRDGVVGWKGGHGTSGPHGVGEQLERCDDYQAGNVLPPADQDVELAAGIERRVQHAGGQGAATGGAIGSAEQVAQSRCEGEPLCC